MKDEKALIMLIRSDGLGARKAMEEIEGKDGRIDQC